MHLQVPDVTASTQNHSLYEHFGSCCDLFFLLLPSKIIEIYSVSLSHQRCKWISWKFSFGMVKGNHFTTLTPLLVASQSLTYHPNLENALLHSDLAYTRADAQFVQRSAWLRFLYFHMLCIWQNLRKKHSRGKSSQVKSFEQISIAGGIWVLWGQNETCPILMMSPAL